MPEGDSLHAAAARLRVLEGEVLAVEAPHPRSAALGIAPRLDGRRLERVEAIGKNLLLTFEGDVVLRSHLRMRGRWHVGDAGAPLTGKPWLILRGESREAVLWNGPVLELGRRGIARLGPDILEESPQVDEMVTRMRRGDGSRSLGEVLLDQRAVAGIGNMWRAEVLFLVGLSPATRLVDVDDTDLRHLLETASETMKAGRRERAVYGRAGLPCRRCGTRIEARRGGDDARVAYWCPSCQAGTATGSA